MKAWSSGSDGGHAKDLGSGAKRVGTEVGSGLK